MIAELQLIRGEGRDDLPSSVVVELDSTYTRPRNGGIGEQRLRFSGIVHDADTLTGVRYASGDISDLDEFNELVNEVRENADDEESADKAVSELVKLAGYTRTRFLGSQSVYSTQTSSTGPRMFDLSNNKPWKPTVKFKDGNLDIECKPAPATTGTRGRKSNRQVL